MKKENHSCGGASGRGGSQEESSEGGRKHTVTHWASSFHLEKLGKKH